MKSIQSCKTVLPYAPTTSCLGRRSFLNWMFKVPAFGAAVPEPLRDMGHFNHEAVAIDPVSGIVYETEDSTPSGFYRFVPNDPVRLSEGGQLQMLRVRGERQIDLSQGSAIGTTFQVTWVDIDEPRQAHTPGTTDGHGVFTQGFDKGGVSFLNPPGSRCSITWTTLP